MAGADQPFGQRTSDLVLDSKLQTTFHKNYTKHVIDITGPSVHQRRTTQEQRWGRRKPLGRGTFGQVWLEELLAGQTSVTQRAVKVIGRHTSVDYSRELEAFAKFSHRKYARCFVESFGWYQDENSVFITMEYLPLGDLQHYMSTTFPEMEVQQISYQLLEGLSFMHENGFAHRDLKPGNILVRSTSPNWWVKIGDFGISKRAEEGMTAFRTNSGTHGFMAPEIYAQEGLLDLGNIGELREYTVAVDLWSLGEIIFRAFTKEPPFARSLAAYVTGRVQFPSTQLRKRGVSDDGCKFVASLMKPDPKDRLTASEGLAHCWMATQKPESPRSSGELQRSPESPNNYGWREPIDESEATFGDPSNVWSTNSNAALILKGSAHTAYHMTDRTPAKQEPGSSHHTRSLSTREMQDQQYVDVIDLDSGSSGETEYMIGKWGKTYEIVVGIAMGASYSGVSWAANHGSKTVRVINDWPYPHSIGHTSDRVPTVISYQNGEPVQWGFMVDGAGIDSFRFIELLLDPNDQVGPIPISGLTSIKLSDTLNKTTEDMATDYIRMVWNHTKEDIQRVRGDDWESLYKLRVVLTVPAIWPPAATAKILGAARKAGIPRMIDLVPSQEAAALAVMKENRDEVVLKVGDCFVVCDAGKSAVYLISYRIVSLDPLAFAECAPPSDGLCGSVYLNYVFENWIRLLVGEDQYRKINDSSKTKMMLQFEQSIVRYYTGGNQQYLVDLDGVEDNPQQGIDDGAITLKPSALKAVFDRIVDQIMELVHKQIDTLQGGGMEIKAILLIGGFGKSPYIYRQLRDAHKTSEIHVIQSNRAWPLLKALGATLWGLENSKPNWFPIVTVRTSRVRYSYGIFQTGNSILWVLKKGETIEAGKKVQLPLKTSVQLGPSGTEFRYFSEQIYYCADDDPPSRRERSVKELCTVHFGIKCSELRHEEIYRHPTTGLGYTDAIFDLCLNFNSLGVPRFSVKYRGEELSYTEVRYKNQVERESLNT